MDNQYEFTNFDEPQAQHNKQDLHIFEDQQPCLLTKEQQDQMLYSITIKADTQNLLDLSCQDQITRQNSKESENPRYWQFVENRVVEISNPSTISDGYITSYKLYRIKTRKQDQTQFDTIVERRFNDFEYLHTQLVEEYGGWLIPRLPQKNFWTKLDLQTHQNRQERKKFLQAYLTRLLMHQKLRYTQQLRIFLFDKTETFSQKKGDFSSRINYEQTITKFTNNAYQVGISLIGSLLNNQTYQTSKFRLPVTKQDNQILHYQHIVMQLNETLKDLVIIVNNTMQENSIISDLGDIFGQLCDEEFFVPINLEKEKLNGQYEEIFQFIESCKQALERRAGLRTLLANLKSQEENLSIKYKNNPRSMNLDLVRAQIQSTSKRYQQWTKELLLEFGSQIDEGKSMLIKFVQSLGKFRAKMYFQNQ